MTLSNLLLGALAKPASGYRPGHARVPNQEYDQAAVDCIRLMLGLEPLYLADHKSPQSSSGVTPKS